jgi:hypothetical protein
MGLTNDRAKSDDSAVALFADPFLWADSLAKTVRKTDPVKRTMGIKTRRLKKADREAGFFFISGVGYAIQTAELDPHFMYCPKSGTI